jgi:hypothetical protein
MWLEGILPLQMRLFPIVNEILKYAQGELMTHRAFPRIQPNHLDVL